MAKRLTVEPMLWLLFSAGGVLTALLIPVLLLLFGVLMPLGVVRPDDAHVLAVLRHPVTCAVLFVLCTLALFHWAHRFRYTLYDGLQIKHLNELINPFCYGTAILGSAAAGFLLFLLATST